MARVRFGNEILSAKPVRQDEKGNWLMEAQQHGIRWSPGTVILIPLENVIEMDNAEVPKSDGQAELEVAMAKERETLPPVFQTIKDIQDAAKPARASEADALAGGQSVRPFPQR